MTLTRSEIDKRHHDKHGEARRLRARERYAANREAILARRRENRTDACPHCHFTFCTAAYLKRHIENRHMGLEGPQ